MARAFLGLGSNMGDSWSILREAKTYGGQRWDILVFSILESEMREQRRRDDYGSFGLWELDARS